MAKPILMPQVGQDLEEGKLIELKVAVGDQVARGDIVAVVESEKASFEVEAFEAGTVVDILYAEGDTTKVLEPLLFVGEAGEDVSASGSEATVERTPSGQAADGTAGTIAPSKSTESATNSRKTRSSPLARRIALQNKIDITTVKGTGPKGSVVKRDILAAIEQQATRSANAISAASRPQPSELPALAREDREVPFDRMRQVIANRLTLSKQTVPHFYLNASADVTDLQIRRRAFMELEGTKVSINDVLVQVLALTLRAHRGLNAHVAEDRVIHKADINVGVAVAVENGLMVPVIENTDQRELGDIAETIRDHASAARRGVSKSTASGTFSISNLGMFGVEVVPIINPPEAGILGVGPIRQEVRPHHGGIHVRDVLPLTLSADHRAVDGAMGARFLQNFVEAVETYRFESVG